MKDIDVKFEAYLRDNIKKLKGTLQKCLQYQISSKLKHNTDVLSSKLVKALPEKTLINIMCVISKEYRYSSYFEPFSSLFKNFKENMDSIQECQKRDFLTNRYR